MKFAPALLVALGMLIAGCTQSPSGVQPTEQGEGPVTPSSVDELSAVEPGAVLPELLPASLIDCQRNAMLYRVPESIARPLVPDEYTLDGEGVVPAVTLVHNCHSIVIGNLTTVYDAQVVMTYLFLQNSSGAAIHIYVLEALSSNGTLTAYLTGIGLPAFTADIQNGIGTTGGELLVSAPGLEYRFSAAAMFDDRGTLDEEAFLLHHRLEDKAIEADLTVVFASSSQLVGAGTMDVSGGIVGQLALQGNQAFAIDSCMVSGLLTRIN